MFRRSMWPSKILQHLQFPSIRRSIQRTIFYDEQKNFNYRKSGVLKHRYEPRPRTAKFEIFRRTQPVWNLLRVTRKSDSRKFHGDHNRLFVTLTLQYAYIYIRLWWYHNFQAKFSNFQVGWRSTRFSLRDCIHVAVYRNGHDSRGAMAEND